MFNNNEIEVRYNEFVFSPEHRHICDIYPIVPAKKIEKSWWKLMKLHFEVLLSPTRKEFKSIKPTIKYCPGIVDFTNYGYIIPAWCDFQFWVDDDGQIEWQVPPAMKNVECLVSIFSSDQVDSCPILGDTSQFILKLSSPWFIRAPKGTSLIFCKPFYHYSNDFDVCPGVLDSDIHSQANNTSNIFIRFNVRNKVIHIKAGQPLAQIIPFKRMNWKLKHVEWDKKNLDMFATTGLERDTRFGPDVIDKNSMTKSRHDDSNKKFE